MMRALFFIALLLASAASAEHFDWNTIPDGYPEGRVEAQYGSYCTPYAQHCREIATYLEKLRAKIAGLARMQDRDELEQARAVYHLEHRLLALQRALLQLPAEELSTFERQSLLSATRRLYRDTRVHGDRINAVMVREIDRHNPGPNGVQQRREIPGNPDVLYESNGRSEKPLTPVEKKEYYEAKRAAFLKAGGKLEDMKDLTPELLKELPPVARLEYVELPDHRLRVTAGDAGHLLLAEGGPVLAAGQLLLVKGAGGEIEMAVFSAGSGNYKPDLFSVERCAERAAEKYGIPANRLVITQGNPASAQTTALLMKAHGERADTIKLEVAKMEEDARYLLEHTRIETPPGVSCRVHYVSLGGRPQ